MSDVIEAAVEALQARYGEGIDGSARFVLRGEGSVVVDSQGVRAAGEESDDDAEVTLTASVETFRAILDGDMSPTIAFMSGKLTIEGNMGLALRLASSMG